jgi:hypothetical protein
MENLRNGQGVNMQFFSKLLRGFSIGWPIRLALLLLLVLGLPYLAAGQEATIVGTVTDASGGVVAGVTVTITSVQTGSIRTLTTNDAGQYVAAGLPVGKYDVKAEATGFKVEESKGVVLNVNDRDRIDFQMKVGAKTESISVEANAIAVQSDSSEVSSLVNGTQITELATNGRVIYSYVVLTAGASSLMPDSQLPVPVGGNSQFSINGNRPTHNLYLLDGGENADRGGSNSNSSVMPSMDAIGESQILTSNYSADYGLSSGGTISSVVKSGTQTFHGSAWEFFRNDALDARNFFNPAPAKVAELRYNIFGFNVGGPVTFGKLYNPERKKTFFFYNMEWRKIIQGGSPINTTVPNPTTYGGDFSSVSPTLAKLHAPFQCEVSAAIQAQFAVAGQALSGCTAGAPDTTKEVPFNNSKIPSGLLNSYAQSLLTAGGKYGGIFPAPTNGNQFTLPVSSPTDVREEIVRIDHNFTDKFTIYGHFVAEQIAQNFATSMWSGDNVPSIGNTFGNPSYAGVVHTAYVISPTLVNEVSFNYNGNRIAITPAGLFTTPGAYGRFFSGPNQDNRIPSINLNGGTGTNYTVNWMPWNNVADSYQLREDVSWTKGRHQLKMGGSWLLYKKVQDWFKNTQGNYQFNGSFTGNDFADYLLGYAQNYTEDAVKSSGHWNNVSWGLYVQDNWRATNRLTLNLGLRWDGIPHTYEASNQMNNFYPNLYDANAPATLLPNGNTISPTSPGLGPSSNPILAGQSFYVNGVATCGYNDIPSGCVNGAWLNFQPRLGFAYDLTGSGKTIIRGGYGVMNERVQGNDVYNNAGTVPLAASINFTNVLLANPNTGVSGGNAVGIPVNNITGLDKNNYKAPRSTQFSMGIQHSIGKSVLSVSYVGTQNRHQNYYTQMNLVDQSLLPAYVNGTATVKYNSVVPYVGYHDIRIAQNEANGDYNGLQASMRGTLLSNDLTYQVGYTYSHTNDTFWNQASGGDLYNISDPYRGWKYDFGPSMFDRRNIFFANFVYDIPLMKHSDNKLAKTLIGGWEISGIVNVVSGAPLNIGLNGNNVASIVPETLNRPDQTGTGSNPHTVNEWFDTSIYSTPAPGTWGNTSHNSVWGPGRDNWNISFFKNFVFSEARGSNLQFRAEFFNIWNHTQFIGDTQNGGISTNFGASNFGHVTSANDPRIIQLALKLYL